MSSEMRFETCLLSSLSKVFPDEEEAFVPYERASALQNECFSFQVAYRSNRLLKGIKLHIITDPAELGKCLEASQVGLVPSELPIYGDHDGHLLRSAPGLYPDPLLPVDKEEGIKAWPNQWRSIWLTVRPEQVGVGTHSIRIRFEAETGESLGEETFTLDIIPSRLPEQTMIHTEWFHADCLATYYGTEVFSERHWELIERYVRTAAGNGMNMLLTPLFTPPLDTQVGGERPTVQLVDVEAFGGDVYRFGFGKLDRWIEMGRSCGIVYFEFSHLFTQWGAKHAPKIVGTADGETKRLFGWGTDAAGPAYQSFLGQFLPALTEWIRDKGIGDRCYFHVSDEPTAAHLEPYGHASRFVRQHLADFPVIDALSDIAFYDKGLVQKPIPASNHIEPFLERGIEGLWTYYCCSQYKEVANRFFCMPSARSRILGIQLYKFKLAGFLHWGYNFWYSQYSRRAVDPYRVTDADGAFPSGDPFLVYPGENGPIESIRLNVVRDAFQDVRALQLLESLLGRERVLEALEEGLGQPITFSVYPREAEWLVAKREWINREIERLTRG